MGLEIIFNDVKYVFINIYLPYSCASNIDEFVMYLSKLESIITQADTPYVYVSGDFNADVTHNHLFGTELTEFCQDTDLLLSDTLLLNSGHCYTHVSASHGTTSWLDHVLCTVNSHKLVESCKIFYDKVSSDHFPLSFVINPKYVQCKSRICDSENNHTYTSKHHVVWDKLTEHDTEMYRASTQ
jgi:endonuclease/exonuclease/phosphatase family metal-dependent hydrolase